MLICVELPGMTLEESGESTSCSSEWLEVQGFETEQADSLDQPSRSKVP